MMYVTSFSSTSYYSNLSWSQRCLYRWKFAFEVKKKENWQLCSLAFKFYCIIYVVLNNTPLKRNGMAVISKNVWFELLLVAFQTLVACETLFLDFKTAIKVGVVSCHCTNEVVVLMLYFGSLSSRTKTAFLGYLVPKAEKVFALGLKRS